MRVHSRTRDFIDKAAKSIGKDRSDFILEAAYEKAQEIAFNRILDNPPKPNEKLLALLATKAPWG